MPGKSGGHGSRTAKRAAARENKVPSQRTLERRAKKAREAAAAEDYDNVDPHADDIGDADIHDIGDAGNDDVSVGLGAGTSGVGCGAHVEPLAAVGVRAVPAPSFGPHSAYCEPTCYNRLWHDVGCMCSLGRRFSNDARGLGKRWGRHPR